jgi:hypothetical protein
MVTELTEVKKYGRAFKGKTELVSFLSGKKLTRTQSITAYCYICMGYYADGADDCRQNDCPLHPFMSYNKTRPKRVMSPEHIAKMQAGRKA